LLHLETQEFFPKRALFDATRFSGAMRLPSVMRFPGAMSLPGVVRFLFVET
jgi:hypothetical protein